MKVEEVMSTDLIVGYVPGTVKDALKILGDNNVSGMPILKKDTKKIVGILTRTDIFRNPEEEQLALVMSKNIHYLDKDQQLKEAAKMLYDKRIHGLPVINKKKNLVGVVSPKDIIRVLSEKTDDGFVKDYYSRYVVPIYQDTPINVVMEIINITNENALPILNDELKLGGIVSDGDLFKLSHIRESVSQTNMGMGGDEDQWTWEGIRDTVRLHYSISEVTLPDVPVKEIMISNVKNAFENTTICEVAKTMIKHDISHVPVVDANDKLIGMVTDLDLMKCMF